MNTKIYRTGAIGALLDEYERALRELQKIVRSLSTDDYERISNPNSSDPDCLSVQTIMRHVVSSGFGYATYIRNALGIPADRPEIPLLTQTESLGRLDDMFEYTLETFEGRWNMTDDEMSAVLIKTSWSEYDIESMLEHAIVHILRHRRQIEKLTIM